jgi:LuxR family maltose regulon positive regulatory protein
MLEKKQAGWLEENYLALCARFDMLKGEDEKVRGWMEQCPLNDYDSGAPQNAYGLITKAKAYISLGEYRNAATLLESLTLAMQKEGRTLDTIECLVNGAIACDLLGSGGLALGKLEQALLLALEYSYIRVFSDCGRPLFNLIMRYMKETSNKKLNEAYLKRIAESAKVFASLHPMLYASKSCKADEGEELTQSEAQILHLLGEGKTNKAIAKELSVQPSTVSFHLTNLFEKLGASNRTEAVKVARDKGIL